ncbi:MAG: hypothetical protein ACRCXM_06205 [Beijerinckiaceae bacterium]
MPHVTTHRRFILIGGYYPVAREETRRRFAREYQRFLKTWSLEGAVTPDETRTDHLHSRIETRAPDWQSCIDYTHVYWDDLIAQDRERTWRERLPLALRMAGSFFAHGAFRNYFRTAWRYAMFFLYPLVLLALIALLSFLAPWLALRWSGFSPTWLWALPPGAALFALLLPVIGNRLHIDHLLDDWIYAHRMIREGDPAVSQRLDALAAELAQERRELLIVGHSFGAVHAIELIARIRALAPDGAPIRFASVGSSILKLALHGKADALRARITQVAQAKHVIWRDIYAVNDYMNFCDADPVRVLKLSGQGAQTLKVQFRGMLTPDFYRSMELNYFRLHSQFISGNDRRAPYDYFMLMCGPLPLETVTRDRKGLLTLHEEDGALKDDARALLAAQGAEPRP